MARPDVSPLRLRAQDADDMQIVGATLQDAVLKVGDIRFDAKSRELTALFNRYRWESGRRERVRSALQLGSVTEVKARKIRTAAKDAVLVLLAVGFEPTDAPSGALTFRFAGGGELRVGVECIEGVLADVSTPWPTPRTPRHD